jgi:hypothetical protein
MDGSRAISTRQALLSDGRSGDLGMAQRSLVGVLRGRVGVMTETPNEVPDQSEQLDQIQPEDSLLDRGVDDVLDEGYSPPEKWSPAERYGNTLEEQRQGESLDQRLTQEEPEESDTSDEPPSESDEFLDDGEVGDERAGRLVDPDEGVGEDVEKELLGSDVGIDGAAASAEEAAVHVVDEGENQG